MNLHIICIGYIETLLIFTYYYTHLYYIICPTHAPLLDILMLRMLFDI